MLTGIHLSSYGLDLEHENLLTLLETVHQVEGIERIRLGSLEPGIITEEFAKALSGLPKVCPHFHLSLQSGCSRTLLAMNRRYTAQQYREKCEILRRYYEKPALTTDVIVGFPGETQEDFEESLRFVEGISFAEIHVFKYSRRHGTKAAAMEGQIPEQIKGERSSRMNCSGGAEKKRVYGAVSGKRNWKFSQKRKYLLTVRPAGWDTPRGICGRLFWIRGSIPMNCYRYRQKPSVRTTH